MWKLLWVTVLVTVFSTYHVDAYRKRVKHAIGKSYQVQDLRPPFNFVKGQDAIIIESDHPGYDYTTPKPEGYVYTPGKQGYVYVTPTVTLPTPTTRKQSTPGTTYLPPVTGYLPPTTTTTSTTTTTTTPKPTTTTTTTTTPKPTTTTTTTTTTPRTTTTPSTTPFKPYTYLPPPTPPNTYIPPVKPTPFTPPSVRYTTGPTIRVPETTYRYNKNSIRITPTLPRPTPTRPYIGYEYLPPDNKYLPVFETRKR